MCGAALASLDLVVREAPPWLGTFRQRLALRAEAAPDLVSRALHQDDQGKELVDALD